MLRVAIRLWEGDRNAAEETVQDAIVSALRAVRDGKFHDFPNFRPWILKILVNCFQQEVRRNRRFVPLESDGAFLEKLVASRVEPFADSVDPVLMAAINTLGLDQRACVVLIAIDGLDYEEAATLLNVPIGTIRSRLARARMKMASYLATTEYGEST